MKKIVVIGLSLLMVLAVFTGCKSEEAPSAQPTKISTPTATPEVSAEPTEANAIPENVSPTTGLENTTTKYKPVMVQIDNESRYKFPQWGIQLADVVYETPVEGTDTRLTILLNDAIYSSDAPDKLVAGPVRSTRYYHQWIQSEWDALFVHMGGPDTTANAESNIWGASSEHVKQRINGAGKHAVHTDMFFKDKDGVKISDKAMTDVIADAKLYDYEPKQRQSFKYYPLEQYTEQPEIEKIELSFYRDAGYIEYRYDSSSDKLTRYMKGKEVVSGETGEGVEIQNLIIQYTNVEDMPKDYGRKKVDVFGSGKAEFVIHGKHMMGTWEREKESDPTVYYLENGDEVTLTPGNTWIEIHPDNRPVVTTFADGSDSTTNSKSDSKED